ncbi:MAG: response regulator [Polyangiales bacterium]
MSERKRSEAQTPGDALDVYAHTEAIASASTLGDASQAIARALRHGLGADLVYVAVVDGGGRSLQIAAIARDEAAVSGHLLATLGTPLDEGAERWALGASEPSWIADAEGLAARSGGPKVDALLTPLGARGVAVALTRRPIDARTLQIARAIGVTGRVALEHVSAVEDGHGLASRLQAVLAFQRTLAGGLLEDVFAPFATRLAEEVTFDLAWVGALSATPGQATQGEAHTSVEVLALHPAESDLDLPRPGGRIALADTPIAHALRSGQARSGGPTFFHGSAAATLAPWAQSAVIVPLVVHDAVVGVFVLLSRTRAGMTRGGHSTEARWLLGALAEPLAMAAQNKNLFDGLRVTMREWERTFDVMDALVFITDAAGKVRRANWAIARRLSVAPSALVGRDAASLFPGQQLPLAHAPAGASVGPAVRVMIAGPRGEPLRASAVALAEGGMVVVLHDSSQPTMAQTAQSYAALRRISTPSGIVMRGKVLVVDDEPSILRAVSRTLGRSHEITTATDGDEALELIRNGGDFDAIITDVQMARLGGIELYRQIEHERPRLAERFVFMTGGVFATDIEQFLRGLGPRVLRKPFDPELLRRAIDARVALSRVA